MSFELLCMARFSLSTHHQVIVTYEELVSSGSKPRALRCPGMDDVIVYMTEKRFCVTSHDAAPHRGTRLANLGCGKRLATDPVPRDQIPGSVPTPPGEQSPAREL